MDNENQPETPETPENAVLVEGSETPYRNLWVPLIVVPAVVVGIIVLVFALFGQISGNEAGIVQNLERMISGGKNQRDQAAFNLVRQVLAGSDAGPEGASETEAEKPTGADLSAKLTEAWAALDEEEDLRLAFVVAMLTAHYELPQANERLARFLELDPALDPGELRVDALKTVARMGLISFAPQVRRLAEDEDHGVRLAAVATLQAMPGEENQAALRAQLGHDSIEIRAMAAVSLSHLGDPAGANLLRDLSGPEIYADVRSQEPLKFANASLVRSNRIRAVESLGRLKRPVDRDFLQGLASDEPDIEVREAALRALADTADSNPQGSAGPPSTDSPDGDGD